MEIDDPHPLPTFHETDSRAMDESNIAIIGDGVAALITMGVLCQAGVPPEAITIYGDSRHALANLERYARSVGQTRMRSEGEGHLRPENVPGLATIDSWRQRSPLPLLASLVHCYTPPLDLLLSDAKTLARELCFDRRRIKVRVEHIVRRQHPHPSFWLFDNQLGRIGAARHVVLALGHPGLAWPAAALPWVEDPRIQHAYQEPTISAGEHIVIVGGGMAAAHVWMTALDAGARVTALHRGPVRHQQLSAPRCSFSAAGIDAYHRLTPEQRSALLMQGGSGTFPWRWRWEWQLRQAARSRRFVTLIGELVSVSAGGRSGDCRAPLTLQLADTTTIRADRVICATGFQTNALTLPLIRQLVEMYNVPTANGMLCVNDDCTLPPLSQPESMCIVVGALARWGLPVADSFAGIKYAVRRLAPQLSRA